MPPFLCLLSSPESIHLSIIIPCLICFQTNLLINGLYENTSVPFFTGLVFVYLFSCLFFWLLHTAAWSGLSVPRPGVELRLQWWKHWILTAILPGNSPKMPFFAFMPKWFLSAVEFLWVTPSFSLPSISLYLLWSEFFLSAILISQTSCSFIKMYFVCHLLTSVLSFIFLDAISTWICLRVLLFLKVTFHSFPWLFLLGSFLPLSLIVSVTLKAVLTNLLMVTFPFRGC